MRRPCGRWAAVLVVLGCAAAPGAAQARTAGGPEARLDTGLADLARADARGASVQALADARRLTVTPGERVLVEIHASVPEATAEARLDGAGADVLASAPGAGSLSVTSAWVPVDELAQVAATRGVRAVVPVQAFGTDAGAALSKGDAAHAGPAARALGATGAGVKVGVISDSINQVGGKVAGSQASGDLPAGAAPLGVRVISDAAGGSDEGRAMAEIVYDTAPGITQFSFASGTVGGAPGKVAAIDALVADGAKIIADDIFYLSEPFFQDGAVSQAVDRARAAGVLYLASAGNRARQSYESAPRFPAGPDAPHDFDPGAATDTTQTLTTIPDAGYVQVALQWDEAWGSAQTDVDLELVRIDNGATLATGYADNPRTGLPSEVATWVNDTGDPVEVGVRIIRYGAAAGAPPVTRLKYVAHASTTFTVAEHDTSSDAINPDAAAAAGSLAVAAVRWNDAGLDTPEEFSSRGPKTRLFSASGARLAVPEVRQKPELAAADGVATTVPGFSTFYGTSAAVPSAAGVAALVLSAKPALPGSLLRAILTDPRNTNDCAGGGLPDLDCGWGFVFADRAVTQAKDATPPTVAPVVSPATPTGANGWWTGDVSVRWNAADGGSPVEPVSGCATTTHRVDGWLSSSCTARSAGGTTSAPAVTVKRDASPPTAPVVTGIAATAYTPATVPPASAVSCTATDAASGVQRCVLAGYGSTIGTHTLIATATDNAGLTRTSTLTYRVVAPPLLPAADPELPQAGAPVPPAAKDVVRLPAATRCVRRGTRLKLTVRRPRTGAIRSVTVRVTGVKRPRTVRRTGTITLPALRRKRVTVRVTVAFADGRRSAVRRTYRRC